jgi:hypothetical protein
VHEWRGCLAGGHVLDDVPTVAHVVHGGHQCGLDGGKAPIQSHLPEQRGEATDVRSCHGRAGDDVDTPSSCHCQATWVRGYPRRGRGDV